eukprot:3814400-Pyramimonas_sp.AAC.1
MDMMATATTSAPNADPAPTICGMLDCIVIHNSQDPTAGCQNVQARCSSSRDLDTRRHKPRTASLHQPRQNARPTTPHVVRQRKTPCP